MIRRPRLLATCLVLASAAQGIPAARAAEDGGAALERIEWSGELESSANTYDATAPQQTTAQEAVVRAHLRPRVDLEENVAFKSDLLFRADAGNPTRDTVRIDEASVTARLGSSRFTLRAGKVIYAWGNDAIFSPTDFLNPRDYYDLFHPDKLGVLATDLSYAASDALTFDVGVVPVFQPSVVSDPTSRWINYTPFVTQAVVSKLGLPANLPSGFSVPFDLQHRNPKFPQLFARMSLKTVRFDASLAYSYRYNPFPQVVLFASDVRFDAINGLPLGQVQGVPYYQQEHLLAFDANVPILGAVVFLNSTLSIPDAVQRDIPSSTSILANFNQVGLGSNVSSSDIESARKSSTAIATLGLRRDWSRVHAYAQYARIWYLQGSAPTALLGQAVQGTGVNPADVYDFFSGTLIPGLSWDVGKHWTVRGAAILNLRSSGVVADGGLDYRVAEGCKVSLAYDYVNGKEGSLLGYYSGNSRLSLGVSLVF